MAKDFEDYKMLEMEIFQRNEINFWHVKVEEKGFQSHFFNYPGCNELRIFSTFHWAVYMVVKKCSH